MSASVGAATVRPAATVESSTTMEAATVMESAMESAASHRSAAETAFAVKPATEAAFTMECAIAVESVEFSGTAETPAPLPAVPVKSRSSSIEARAMPVGMAVETMEPGSGTDKDAANKVVRPVITIGCAGVWIVAVVSVCTVRRRTSVNRPRHRHDRANAHCNRHLSASRSDSRREHQQSQHESVL